ncbi:hypothetical protein AGMMS49992_19430 [Clostridia bacterium]|nr:hypothetical protein AGMMS49992_19430 [Clostridia bacterium]
MAKDGTNRGGRRVKAGTKPATLVDKLASGKSAKALKPYSFQPDTLPEADDLSDAADLIGTDMPPPSEYLSARQKDGKPLGADALYAETWQWLKERGCEKFLSPRLIEAYSQAFARYIQSAAGPPSTKVPAGLMRITSSLGKSKSSKHGIPD